MMRLALDAHSLVFAGGVSAFMTMLALVAARRGFPASIRGLELWAAGSCAQAVGAFFLTFRDALPEWMPVLFGHSLLVLGQALMYHAIRRFRSDRPRPELVYTPAVFVFFGVLVFWWLVDLIHVRAAIYAAGIFIPLALSMHLLITGFRDRLRQPALLTAAAFATIAVLLLYQAVNSVALEISMLDAVNFGYILFVALYGGLSVLATFGFLLMANERLRNEIEHMATLDSLTEVFNRRTFVSLAEAELARSDRTGSKASLVFLDMDRFKQINDTHGHGAGDQVLLEFVRCTRQVLRRQDIFGRFGGEEFCLLLPETGIQAALMVAERARAAVSAIQVTAGGQPVRCTVSAGVSGTEIHGADLDAILRGADKALYAAKRAGRDRSMLDGAASAT
jgi:diguanylate cyclase (GGDEF)-like protein